MFNPVVATLLQLPGLWCWIVFFLVVGLRIVWHIESLACALPLAILTAIASIFKYLFTSKRRPWYVLANLFTNLSGLLFIFVGFGSNGVVSPYIVAGIPIGAAAIMVAFLTMRERRLSRV